MSPMDRAIAIAATSIDDPGALPYGAVVVRDGQIIGEGLNRALALNDPTSHGEVEAIRDARRKLGLYEKARCQKPDGPPPVFYGGTARAGGSTHRCPPANAGGAARPDRIGGGLRSVRRKIQLIRTVCF